MQYSAQPAIWFDRGSAAQIKCLTIERFSPFAAEASIHL